MSGFYVGLMSGTSMDGIDAVLVSFGEASVDIRAVHSEPYPQELKDALFAAIREPLDVALDQSGELHRKVGEAFLDAARAVIEKSGVAREEVAAIGSHGQTLRHQPNAVEPFSLQIGRASIIAAGTGTTTICNFRAADIAAGGQGAPLVPPFHRWLFGSGDSNRVIVNIGGIANITVLPADGDNIIGFDTGPGNGLMDAWISRHLGKSFDKEGEWAGSATVDQLLLGRFRDDPYFSLHPPKSTGFEYFNPNWLQEFATDDTDAADVQATLCELSAATIAAAITEHAGDTQEVFVCGGGVHNSELMRRLRGHLPEVSVTSTLSAGLDPDWVEAVAFAWLAMRTLYGQSGNLPSVTGATHKVVLGDIHSPKL
jgi:anhydro-N-acetylmuramic acid kinase